MSDFQKMAQDAAKQQAAHVLGFGLNTIRGALVLWIAAETLVVLAVVIGFLSIIVAGAGWWSIPAAIVIINLVRFAHAYGKAKHGK